jgi:peptide/nickel transport system ATP-binding protein
VGESGSGKSMTAKALTGLLPARRHGHRHHAPRRHRGPPGRRAAALTDLRGRRISLLLQNPFTSLSPVHRCGQQIAAALPAAVRGNQAEVLRRLEEVDLPARVAKMYPFELSGGMRQRVALAASLAADPLVLIGDEPTTALDVTTQREVLNLLARIQQERSMAFVLITHDLGVARERAERILVMYAGRLVESGPGSDVFTRPLHPYTSGLRDSEPPLAERLERLPPSPGVCRARGRPAGCVFAPRCSRADHECTVNTPVLEGDDRRVACWKPLGEGDHEQAVPVRFTDHIDSTVNDLVVVRNLTKRFAATSPPALDDVSITVAAGEAVGVVGESGSGKTTLARCLVELERADTGTITWADGDTGARRAQIVFQDPSSALNPAMTVEAALAEALRAGGRDRSEVAALLDLVGLPASYAKRRPNALSGGEQQRVAIARALAPRPRLLICDEPVSSLDVSVQAQILNLMNELLQELGIALLFITHDLAVVRQVVRRVYVMHHGRVVESGVMDELISAPQHDYTRLLFASVPGR